MSFIQKARCRDVRGPTPHSVAVKEKPRDYRILERKQYLASERESLAEFAVQQRRCDIKNSWIQSSNRRYVKNSTERQVIAGIHQSRLSLDERRERLRVLLETEEQQYLKEVEESMRTALQERQTKMVERVKVLKGIRETRRQQMVSEKMEQLFINQCEEVRAILNKRKEEETRGNLAAQVQLKKEQQQLEQMVDKRFVELRELTHQMEIQKESERAQRAQQRTSEHMNHLRAQMDAAEQQRQQAKRLKDEEAGLLFEHREMLRLQAEREQQQRLSAQQMVKRQLDQGYRMKMKRLAKEQQEELALDMTILQHVSALETDEKQEASLRKSELREQQQRYRQYLADEMEKQKREEKEIDLLLEEKLKELLDKQEKQRFMEREARNRLMKEVLDGRNLQIQHKLNLNKQKQAQLAAEREELNQLVEEIKSVDRQKTRLHKERSQAYQADLQAQIHHQQHLKQHEKALEEREFHCSLAVQHEYERMKERVLSRPISHATAQHPFRCSKGGAKSAPAQRMGTIDAKEETE